MEKGIDGNCVDYSALPQLYINLPGGVKLQLTNGYNCPFSDRNFKSRI